MRNRITLFTVLITIATIAASVHAFAQSQTVSIVIVRHAESDATQPTQPLSPKGLARADLLIQTLHDVKFTHFFSTHTTRARQVIEKIAAAHGLPVVQLPKPGSMLNGEQVTDKTTRQAPIELISEALLNLPAGSVALVGLNSENIYAILNRLGVPVAPPVQSCSKGSMCVPCTTGECYPREDFDRLWHVVRQRDRAEPIGYLQLRYGAGWPGQ
jgi:phosphohistidine phosphatase SixA